MWPVYRVLDNDGSVRADAVEPELKPELAVKVYENMVRLEAMDDIFYSAQRQVTFRILGYWLRSATQRLQGT